MPAPPSSSWGSPTLRARTGRRRGPESEAARAARRRDPRARGGLGSRRRHREDPRGQASMVCVAWFVGWVALAPQVPAAPADARVVPAVEWLCERVDEVARKDEPLVGLSPAIVALALASAGRSEPMRRLQDALQRTADLVVSTPAPPVSSAS